MKAAQISSVVMFSQQDNKAMRKTRPDFLRIVYCIQMCPVYNAMIMKGQKGEEALNDSVIGLIAVCLTHPSQNVDRFLVSHIICIYDIRNHYT